MSKGSETGQEVSWSARTSRIPVECYLLALGGGLLLVSGPGAGVLLHVEKVESTEALLGDKRLFAGLLEHGQLRVIKNFANHEKARNFRCPASRAGMRSQHPGSPASLLVRVSTLPQLSLSLQLQIER